MRLLDPLVRPEGKIHVPVAIFSMGEQRKFLPISEYYQVSNGLPEVVVFFDVSCCYSRTCSDGLLKISIWKRMSFSLFEHPRLMAVEEGKLKFPKVLTHTSGSTWMTLMSVLWNERKVCSILLNHLVL